MIKKLYLNFLVSLGAILSFIDYIITKKLVQEFGNQAEQNPIMKSVIVEFGIDSILWFKCLFFLVLLICCWFIPDRLINRISFYISIVNIALALTVLWGVNCLVDIIV